jgi:hypothetical protein
VCSANNGMTVAETSGFDGATLSGVVIHGESGKTYTWNAALGSSKLLIDGSPSRMPISGARGTS